MYTFTSWRTLVSALLSLAFLSACWPYGGSVAVNVPADDRAPAQVRQGGPPPHAPAHGYRRKYSYRYYPDSHVYFDAGRGLYFYLSGSEWRMSASLPYEFKVRLGHSVDIEMESDRPYTDFASHKSKYPPGQKKKKKNK